MRHTTYLFILAIVLGTLCACGEDDSSDGSETSGTTSSNGATSSGAPTNPGQARADPAGNPNWCVRVTDGVYEAETSCDTGTKSVQIAYQNNTLISFDGKSCAFIEVEDGSFCGDAYDCEGCRVRASHIDAGFEPGDVVYGCEGSNYCGQYLVERNPVNTSGCDASCASLCSRVPACLEGCGC